MCKGTASRPIHCWLACVGTEFRLFAGLGETAEQACKALLAPFPPYMSRPLNPDACQQVTITPGWGECKEPWLETMLVARTGTDCVSK